jgi:hypothetical protein
LKKPLDLTAEGATFGSTAAKVGLSFGTAASSAGATTSFAALLEKSGKKKDAEEDESKDKENDDETGEDQINFEVPIETKGNLQEVEGKAIWCIL